MVESLNWVNWLGIEAWCWFGEDYSGEIILGEVVGVSRPTLVNLMMVEVRKRNFWHGSGFVSGNIFTFFYFTDLDKGLITFSNANGENLLIRLSAKTVAKKPDMPNMN